MFGQRKYITVLISTVAAFFVVIIALAAAPLIIPTSSYRQALIKGIGAHTGASVTIDSISVRLLPMPSFSVRGITVSSPEEQFKQQPLAHIRHVSGPFSLIDILKHRLITKLTITGYEINYLSTTSGSSNFDRLFLSLGIPAIAGDESKWLIRIDAISAKQGKISVRAVGSDDGQSIRLVQLDLTQLQFGARVSGNAYLKAAMFGSATPNVELGGAVSFDRTSSALRAQNCKLALLDTTATLDAALVLKDRPIQFDIHGATPSITAPELAALFPAIKDGFPAGIALSGNVALDIHLKGTREQTAIEFQAEGSRSSVTLGSLFVKPPGRLLKVNFAGTNSTSHLDIEKLIVRLGSNLITIAGSMLHQQDHQAQLTISTKDFNLAELKPSLPWLAPFEEATNPSASLTVQGSLDNPANRLIFGELTAASLTAMGVEMSDAKMGVHYERETTIELPTITANLYGGTLSANGSIDLSGVPRYTLRAVISNADVAMLPRLDGAPKGRGTLVVNATTSGGDSVTLASAMKVSGTLVMPRAEFPTLGIAKGLLAQSTWTRIGSSIEGILIDEGRAASLADTTAEAQDLHASFTLDKGLLELIDVRYRNPRYTLWFSGSIGPDEAISCNGSLWLDKTEIVSLITNAKQRKDLVNTSGDLQIPFELKGKGKGLILRLQADEFATMLKDKRFSATPTVSPVQ